MYKRQIDCRIRSVPYPMLDMIARSMERLGRKSAKEPPLTHYGVSKLNFDFTLDITRAQEELGYQPVITLDEGCLLYTSCAPMLAGLISI